MQCVNKNLREYQSLKHDSGLSDSELSHQVGKFLDEVGRYPYLDELDGANSESAIKGDLKLNKDNITNTSNILEATNSETVDDAVQVLNNKYRDKEVEISEYSDGTSKVIITERPSINPKVEMKDSIQVELDNIKQRAIANGEVNSFQYFNDIIDKLQTLYGINIIPVTNVELQDPKWDGIAEGAKAFIYNGDIYVNTDIATLDSPVHEFLHILFGGLKYNNRELYNQIVSQAEQFDSYNEIALNYPNRTREDINEEVFVAELAKYLVGTSNTISNLPNNIQYEIFYNINRTLDTMLMGDASVKCIPEENLYQMNMKTLAKLVNSSAMTNNFQTTLTDSMLSRIMSNKKSELMEKGLLREDCE